MRLRPLFANKPPLWHTLDVAILHVGILEALLGIDEVRLREEVQCHVLARTGEGRGACSGGQVATCFLPESDAC